MAIKRLGRLKIYAKPTLRYERIKRGWTLTKFAELAGYSTAAMGKIEIRRNGLKPNRTLKILELFDMEFDELFEFIEGEPNV